MGQPKHWTTLIWSYFPRDAMLARVPAMALCLSVTSRCSIERDERIGLILGMGTSLDLSYTAL